MKQVNLKNHEIQINTLEFFVINFSRILVPTTLLSLFFPRTYDKTKNTPIVIFGESIIPGESKTINVEIARLHTTTKLNIPVIVRRSKIDGPVVLFQQEFMEMKLMESKLFGN
jgi:spore maturation protein SpmA